MSRALLLAAALLAAACAPRATVPEGERQRARELEGARRYARVALFVGPFFGDGAKLLASDQPFGELDLLTSSDGAPIAPPPAERVLLPGTAVRVERIEFPTGWIIARRVVMTPRYHPWVYLAVEGEPRPIVLVLSQTVKSADEVRSEIERVLVPDAGAGQAFHALPDEQRAAVARKELVEGMTAPAVEMAWGYPEKKVIDRPAAAEEWIWPDGKRSASLRAGKLTRWERAR